MVDRLGLIERAEWDRAAEAIVQYQSITAAKLALDNLRSRHEAAVKHLTDQHRGAVEALERIREDASAVCEQYEPGQLRSEVYALWKLADDALGGQ